MIMLDKNNTQRKPNLSHFGCIILILSLLAISVISCSTDEKQTDYAASKLIDQGQPTDYEALKTEVGEDTYTAIVDGIGQDSLDRLTYGAGQSNIITLINNIDDVSKLVALLSGTDALSPNQVVGLLDATDFAIGEEGTANTDTLAKIYKLINMMNDMTGLKGVVQAIEDVTFSDCGPNYCNGMARLGRLVALMDENTNKLPNLLNDTTTTTQGVARVARLLNEVEDIKDLADMLTAVSNISNVGHFVNYLTNSETELDGVDSLVKILNEINDVTILSTVIDGFAPTMDIANDEYFESTTTTVLRWALSGDQNWGIGETATYGGSGTYVAYATGLDENEIAAAEAIVDLWEAGQLSFDRRTETSADHTRLQFYINDVLVENFSGSEAWATYTTSTSYPAGTYRLRWELTRDDSGVGSTSDWVAIDNIILPGNSGPDIPPAAKAAILYNKLTTTSQDSVLELLEGLDATGLSRMVEVVTGASYPVDYSTETPKFIDVINDLSNIPLLIEILENLTDAGVGNLNGLVQATTSTANLDALLENMSDADILYNVLNGVTTTGVSSMAKLIDRVDDINNIILLMTNVTNINNMIDLVNNLDLSGTFVTAVESDTTPTSGQKLADLINEIDDGDVPGNSVTVEYHLVRLINDLSSVSGAALVGTIVSATDNAAIPDGITRMVTVMDALSAYDDANRYTDPSSTSTLDTYGRLTTLFNAMNSTSSTENIVVLINGLDEDKLDRLPTMLIDIEQVRFFIDVVNNLTNPDLLITIVNSEDLILSRLMDIMNAMGNKSYETGDPPGTLYTDALSTDTTDALGRMIVAMNEIVTDAGATALSTIINDLDDLNKLTGMVAGINLDGTAKDGGGMHAIRYISSLLNNVANVDLVINALNGIDIDGVVEAIDYTEFVRLCNEIGASTQKGDGIKEVGDLTIIAEVLNELGWDYDNGIARPAEDQAKLIILVNNVNRVGVIAAYDLNNPWWVSHQTPEPAEGDGNKRLTDIMLGMNDALPMSILVGDVYAPAKTVMIANGLRDVSKLTNLLNYMPGEVMRDLVNELYDNYDTTPQDFDTIIANQYAREVMYGSAVFMMNRMSWNSLAALIHFGTGIPEGSSRTGDCNYFTGVGPKRLARMMNAETGERILPILDDFGWRTSTAAFVCGLSTPNAGSSQTLTNHHSGGSDQSFSRTETVRICGDRYEDGGWINECYDHVYSAPQVTDANGPYNCFHYFDENCSAVIGIITLDGTDTDNLLWNGYDYIEIWPIFPGIHVDPGIINIWSILMEEGFVGTLLAIGMVDVPQPPSPKDFTYCQVRPDLGEPAVIYNSVGNYSTRAIPEYDYPKSH